MSKQHNIRWRAKDSKRLANTVRNFNSKITRTLNKHPELAPFLPDRITTSEIRNKVKTRADFNREIKSYQRFMRRGAEAPVTNEKGLMLTKWEKQEVGIKVGTINRQRARERKKADVSPYKGNMHTIAEANLLNKKYNFEGIEPKRWKTYVRNVEKQVMSNYTRERDEQYKENYLRALDNALSHDDARRVKEVVQKIDATKFKDLYFASPELEIGFIYDPQESESIADVIIDRLEEYL